ncbi:MAG: YbaK/EbsC family protein [Patescibacteria group bacterium]|nr:YbaK/EbsC family protein [Patescibacteria group bacterium]
MPKISKKLEKILDEANVKYEIVEHKTTYTAHDKAATTAKTKVEPAEIVKALVLKVDKDYILALLSSNKDLDKVKFKKAINDWIKKERKKLEKSDPKTAKKMKVYKKVELAKEVWMRKNVQGKVGAVPPFSKFTKLLIFVDKLLLRQKYLYLGSGEYELSVKMTPKRYEKLETDLIKGSFTKTKAGKK